MQILYKDYSGKVIEKKTIETIKKKFKENSDKIISLAAFQITSLRNFDMNVKGKNYLLKGVLKKLVLDVLDNDIKDAPFNDMKVEETLNTVLEFEYNNKSTDISLYGRADRIDCRDGIYRIIDYKTGKKEFKSQKNDLFEEIVKKLFSDVSYRENFQAYFYSYLYKKNNPDKQLKVGLYMVRDIKNGIKFLNKETISDEEINSFENSLKLLFNDIFDINKPFSQTEDEDHCKYCSFNKLCYK
jgi:hypothetical protein